MGRDLRIERRGRAGRITLTRPQALNALSEAMVAEIDAALRRWADDAAVQVVVIDAEGPRAFCAGGDVAEIYRMGRAGDFDGPRRYWRDEYRMNRRIATYPKPIVAFMQGFVMGGGVGLGGHAHHRIIGETTRMAMPECGIGLVPDVGGTHLLARAPGQFGLYLGLTGARMDPGAALHAGFADRFVPEAAWPDLIAALEAGQAPADLPSHSPPASALVAQAGRIDALFSGASVADVIAALARADDDLGVAARSDVMRASPLSLLATFALIGQARAAPGVAEALTREFCFTARAPQHADFLEGVRAQIIDKDRSPHWRHASVDAVPGADLAALLAPLSPADGAFCDLWESAT